MTLLTVQALRGIAALLVVAYHAIGGVDGPWQNGSAGVDIFFVISGLVMVLSAERLRSRPHAWRIFARQRINRIVPLYWCMTIVKCAFVLALPALALRTRLNDPAYIVGSFLFLPMRDARGEFFPLLPVGWTLSYEMLFYALVTLSLALRRPILAIAGPALAAVMVVAIVTPGGAANPIVIEFLAGVLIGHALISERQAVPLPAIVLGIGAALLLTIPVGSASLRPLTWGLPAAAIVAGAVALEGRLKPAIPGWMLALGDASYSIYLTHLFVLPAVAIIVGRNASLPAMLVTGLVASSAVGYLVYLWIERPLLHWLRPARPMIVRS